MLTALAVVGTVLWLLDRRGRQRDAQGNLLPNQVVEPDQTCSDDCCGTHEVCPSEQLLRGELCDIIYYDDEELDQYRGRSADGYTEDELEQWRDVLYTLKHDDLLGWERSIKKRGIAIPDVIKEELMGLYNS